MPQTKTKSRQSTAPKGGGRARKSGSGSRSKPKRSTGSPKARTTAARTRAAKGTQGQGGSAAGGPGGAMDKAKGPLVAGGAALLGVAGGVAAARNGRRRGGFPGAGLVSHMPKPRLKMAKPSLKGLPKPKDLQLPKPDASTIDWVETRAKTVGDAGYRVAALTADARKAQKAMQHGRRK